MDRFFSTLQALSPVLQAADSRSPKIDELLFGEVCECVGEEGKYYKVRHLWDLCEGFIQRNQLVPVSEDYAATFAAGKWDRLFLPAATVENERSGIQYTLSAGSVLPGLENNRFRLAEETFSLNSTQPNRIPARTADIIRDSVILFLNVPEVQGGRSIMGMDRAGFCQQVFAFAGIRLSPGFSAMAAEGTHVDFVHELRCGDIAFFSDPEGEIIHAGISIDDGWIIHADGKVKSGRLDQQGLYDPKENRYIYQLRLIKRYF